MLLYKDIYKQALKDNHGDKDGAKHTATALIESIYGNMSAYEEKYNNFDFAEYEKNNNDRPLSKRELAKKQYISDLEAVKNLQTIQPSAKWTYKKYKDSLNEDLYKKPEWEEEEDENEIVGYDEDEEIDEDEEDEEDEEEEDEDE